MADEAMHLVTDPAILATVRNILLDPAESDTLRNEAANVLRRHDHPGLRDDLIAILADEREGDRFRSFAAQHLEDDLRDPQSAEQVRALLRPLLDEPAPAVQREVLRALALIGDATALARLETWINDPQASWVHDLCCRLAADLGRQDLLPAIQAIAASGAEDDSGDADRARRHAQVRPNQTAAQRAVAALTAGDRE